MKKIQLVITLSFLMLFTNSNAFNDPIYNCLEQTTVKTVTGVFDGYDAEDGYVFIISTTNDDDVEEEGDDEADEETIYFTEITAEALKMVNLKDERFVGRQFEITYSITEYEAENDYGETETFEKLTITNINSI